MKIKKIEDKMRKEMKEHRKKMEILEYKRELRRKQLDDQQLELYQTSDEHY